MQLATQKMKFLSHIFTSAHNSFEVDTNKHVVIYTITNKSMILHNKVAIMEADVRVSIKPRL